MSTVGEILVSMRPKQWTKNLIVFAPLIFSGRITEQTALANDLFAFVVFCLISGAVYLMNDLRDLEQDRHHVKKRMRPLASGALRPRVAVGAATALVIVALVSAVAISSEFAAIALGYLLLHIAYNLGLKHIVILDVMMISAGFVIRAAAGSVAVGVEASPWLYMCAALLALFLGFGKRRHELFLLEGEAGSHRAVLEDYSPQLLDMLLSTVTAATIIAYSLYTFFSPAAERHNYLMLTIPFVVYGVFRYVYLMYMRNLGGSPEEILLTDVPLIITVVMWLLTAVAIISFF